MLRHSKHHGYTLVELMVVMTIIGIISTTFFVFFNDSLRQYLDLQKDGSNYSDVATQSQRIANVLRGITDIITEDSDSITCYAYFYPSDAYVSKIKYYKNADNTQLLADVTPMSANPPIGSPIVANKKTYIIIPNFYQGLGVKTFTYLNASGTALSLPITDQQSIKDIQVNLAIKNSDGKTQSVSLQISLRNRKTNL